MLGQQVEEEKDEVVEKGPSKILLVDDDPGARLMMRSLLEKEGFDVHEAGEGAKALELLKADPSFSLLILDLSMPGMDGREVLDKIRGSVDTAALPVLIRTGTGNEKVEAELLEAGADDYLDKSVDATRIVARVKAVLRRSAL